MPSGAQRLPRFDELGDDHAVDLRVHRCSDCGLVQTVGDPVPYYKDVIRSNGVSDAMRSFRVAQLSKWVSSHRLQGAPVLEVGCGRGEFMDLLRSAGTVPVGTEHDRVAADHAISMGHEVWNVFPEYEPLPEHPGFAAWACFNFMEHWPDPRAVLGRIRERLVPGAVGLLEVPNFDLMLQKGMLTEFIPDHIFYFTAETLDRCLSVAGFDVRSIQPIWHDYILSAEVVTRRPAPTLEFSNQLERLCAQLRAFAHTHQEQGIAVWGAGHQALSTLALSGLAPFIRYVVDSAPFKQGRYTPATHLPIRAPASLREDPVGAVIVMAAGYSDEVVNILKTTNDSSLQLAVVRETGLEVL